MAATPLLESTRQLLASSNESLPEISQKAGIGYEWLKKFKADSIPDPSVNRVQRLHDYLANPRAAA